MIQTIVHMNNKAQHLQRDQFIIKSFKELSQLLPAIVNSKGLSTGNLRFSILFRCTGSLENDVAMCTQEFQNTKAVLKDEFSTTAKSGMFFNPEIGTIFCLGNLSSMFLQEINGQALGAIGTGVYGIIRGLGINDEEAKQHVTHLSKDHYLLFVSGKTATIEKLKQTIK